MSTVSVLIQHLHSMAFRTHPYSSPPIQHALLLVRMHNACSSRIPIIAARHIPLDEYADVMTGWMHRGVRCDVIRKWATGSGRELTIFLNHCLLMKLNDNTILDDHITLGKILLTRCTKPPDYLSAAHRLQHPSLSSYLGQHVRTKRRPSVT